MKKRNIVLLLILLGIIFFVSFVIFGNKKLYFSVKGNFNVELSIGSEYTELGFEAKYCNKYIKLLCKDLSDYVELSKREVNDKKFFINYKIKYKDLNKVITREVNFVDKESPVIKLINTNQTYCPNTLYVEEGYKATDNVDGEITDSVKTKIENNKIYYSVSDSSGNKRVIFRDIIYEDNEAPIIYLNGAETIYLFLNQNYNEQGFTVKDNCETDLSSKVTITNNVDNTKVGEYEVLYSVSDTMNNKITKTRKVIVYSDISTIPKNGKYVYLTFDDGPGGYTEEILNILNKYNVKATFFVTNQFSNYNYLIKKEYDSGHAIAVHTYTHNYKQIYSSIDSYLNDFSNMNQLIFEQTGQYSKIFRFPGGSSNTISRFNRGIVTKIANKMTELGYYYFDWNVDSMDTSVKDPNKIYQNVVEGMKKNDYSVVLMHDIKKANIESVEKIISYGLENGYTFLPLDETSPLVHHSINN